MESTAGYALCFRFQVLAAFVIFVTACTPFATKMDSWVGSPMQRRLNIEGARELIKESPGVDDQGRITYVERVGKDCMVYWKVTSDGIIAEWRSEGSACKYYTN